MGKVYNSSSSIGKVNFGWLNANYSFSFTNYINHIQFRLPGALNKAVIATGKGFGTHPQENMKIITLPLPGSLKNMDSTCHNTTLKIAGFWIHQQVYLHFGNFYAENISARYI